MMRLCTFLILVGAAGSAGAAAKPAHRLPTGYAWGRCVLEVDGRKYISGPCAYSLQRDGSFEINGPRQVYAGIDYPETDVGALAQSRDYFAQVDVEAGSGDGFWNADKRSTHAQGHLGILKQRGACWVNQRAKVCLWRR